MDLAQGRSSVDSDAQETSDCHRRAEQSAAELAAGILKHQNGLTAILHKLKGPQRPLLLSSCFGEYS